MLLASVSVVYILVFHVKPKLPKIRSGILQLGDKKRKERKQRGGLQPWGPIISAVANAAASLFGRGIRTRKRRGRSKETSILLKKKYL